MTQTLTQKHWRLPEGAEIDSITWLAAIVVEASERIKCLYRVIKVKPLHGANQCGSRRLKSSDDEVLKGT